MPRFTLTGVGRGLRSICCLASPPNGRSTISLIERSQKEATLDSTSRTEVNGHLKVDRHDLTKPGKIPPPVGDRKGLQPTTDGKLLWRVELGAKKNYSRLGERLARCEDLYR